MRFVLVLFLSILSTAAFAAGFSFEDAFVRETPMKVSAAYITIKNDTGADDALQSVSADWAGKAELHDVKIDNNGVLQMAPMKSLPIKAGSTESLRPGGRHIMIFDLKGPLKAGETKDMVLHFEKAGDVTVPFKVQPIAYRGADSSAADPSMDHSGHH